MPVIVIGAGMAGCAAARRLEAAGIKVIVLEARLRICGRAHSETWRQIDTGGGGGGGGASSTTATAGSSSAANGRVCVPECTVDVGEQIIQGYTRTNPMHRMINSNRFKVVQVQHGIRTSALLPYYRTNSAADGSVGNEANVNMGVHQPSPAAAAAPAAESCLSMPDNQGDLNPQVDPAVMDDVYKLLAKIRKALIYFTPLQSGSRSARDRPRRQSTGDASLPAAPAYPDSTAADTFDVVKALVLAEGGHPPLTPLQDALMASVRARFLGAPMPLELMSWHAVQWLLRLQVESPVLESPVLTPATSELNAAVTIQAAAAAAATAADPSALYYPPLSRLKVDPSAFVVGGVGNLLKKALAPPNVVLGAAVTEVRAGKQTIKAGGPTGYKAKKVDVFRVKCTNGHVHTGSHVLVTVPLGVLQGRVPEAKIAFHPPLSRRKRVAIDKLGYGTINKAILQFDPQVVGKIFPRTPTFHCTDPRFEFYNLDVLSFEANGLISVTIHATAASERAAAKKSAEIQKAAKEAVAKAKERVAEERREQQQLYLDSIKAGTGVSPSSSSPLPKKYPGLKMSAAAAATSAAAAAMTQVAAGVDVAHLGTDVRTVETIVGLLRQMFGADVPMPIRSKVTAWQTDPYAGNGNQAFRAVGSTADDVVAVAEPQGRIFFAGDACVAGLPDHAGSAIDSGLEAAGEIMADIGVVSHAESAGESKLETGEKEHPLYLMARKRKLDNFAGMNGPLIEAAISRRRASFAGSGDSSAASVNAAHSAALRNIRALKYAQHVPALPGLAKGEIRPGSTPPVNSKIVEMVKAGTDGIGKDEKRSFISCRAAMDFLGIQGHSTFYKCVREQIPFNGWLLVQTNKDGGGGSGKKPKAKCKKKRRA